MKICPHNSSPRLRSVLMLFLSGLQRNYWLVWGQSKHAAIQQMWNHGGFLFNWHKYSVCASLFVPRPWKSGFCRMCGPLTKAELSPKTVRWNPYLPALCHTERTVSYTVWRCVVWHGRKSIYRRKRRSLCAQTSESVLARFDCWWRKRTTAVHIIYTSVCVWGFYFEVLIHENHLSVLFHLSASLCSSMNR